MTASFRHCVSAKDNTLSAKSTRPTNLDFAQTLVAGALAGGLLALVQLATFAIVERGTLDRAELVTLFLALLCLLVPTLLVAAAIFGALTLGARAVDPWAGNRGVTQRLGCALVMVAVGGWFAFELFSGEKARRMEGRQTWQGLIVMLFFVLGVMAPWLWARALAVRGRARALLATALTLALVTTAVVDVRVLYRLYPFAHRLLEVGGASCAFVLIAQNVKRLAARLPLVSGVMVTVLLGAKLALPHFTYAAPLRAALTEPTGLGATLFRAWAGHAPAKNAAVQKHAAVVTPTVVQSTAPDLVLGAVNVVVITIDAFRADRLRADLCPTLWQLAQDGVSFTQAYAPVPHTSFSVASLLTGKNIYSLSHTGIEAADHETLPQLLRKQRYKTAGFYPPAIFYIDHDKLHGFEKSAYGFEYVKYEYLPAPARTDQIISFFENEKPQRAFVWAHYFEPHEPYELHGQTEKSLTAVQRYEGEIRFVDGEVKRLVDYLRKTHPRTLIVLAADHGEEFGEHGGRYHGTTLYEEQIHVPLVFSLLEPGRLQPRAESRPVSLVDVAPTVLALLGIEPPSDMRGVNLAPLLRDAKANAPFSPVVAEIDHKKMATDGVHKLLCDFETDTCELFDLQKDPQEKHALEDVSTPLRGYLDSWVDAQARYQAALSDGTVSEAVAAKNVAALPALLQQLKDPARESRLHAARALGQFYAVIATRAQLDAMIAARAAANTDHDPELARWLALAQAVAGGDDEALANAAVDGCARGSEWCARAALRLDDVELLLPALDWAATASEIELEEKVATALGHSGDPRAYHPLLEHLSDVRPRLKVLLAIGALGDTRAIPTLVRWLPAEPYVPVRANMAAVLAALTKRSTAKDRHSVQAALTALLAEETETEVVVRAARALGTLDSRALTSVQVDRALAQGAQLAERQCWLFARQQPTTSVTLDIDGVAQPVEVHEGVGEWHGAARTIRVRKAAPGVDYAYCRVAPTESVTQAK